MLPHNLALANHLEAIAYYEELHKIERYEYRAPSYRVAASLFRLAGYEVLTVFEAKAFKGIGPKISKRVEQFSMTGTSTKLIKLRARDLERDRVVSELIVNKEISIERANDLYEAGVENLQDLQSRHSELTNPELIYLNNLDRFSRVIPREHIFDFEKRVREVLPENIRVIAVGPYRRDEDATEIDLLFTHTSSEVLQIRDVLKHLTLLISDVLSSPSALTSFRGVTYDNRVVNMRLFREASYPQALLHMTGPDPFRTEIRKRAEDIGFHLNEYRLSNSNTIVTTSERNLFYNLDLGYVLPNARTVA